MADKKKATTKAMPKKPVTGKGKATLVSVESGNKGKFDSGRPKNIEVLPPKKKKG